jgi:shikimate kinase
MKPRKISRVTMIIFLTGVSCVGKSTLGKILADRLNCQFYDLDSEIEKYFGESIERLMSRHLTGHSFRYKIGVVVLKDILFNRSSNGSVIALPPSGLKDAYLRAISKVDGVVVAIIDTAENIMKRIAFYDIDSKLVDKPLTDDDKRHYLKEIKKDITYFGKTYKRAHLQVDIAGLSIEDSVTRIQDAIQSRTMNLG